MNKFLAVLAIIAVLGGAFWLFIKDPGPIPMLDRNRAVLADTEASGYCAGEVFWENRPNPNQPAMDTCIASSSLSKDVDLTVVQMAFCNGAVAAGFQGDARTQCYDVLVSERIWPTMDGRITNAWDPGAGYPYPGDTFAGNAPAVPDRAADRTSGDRQVDEEPLR